MSYNQIGELFKTYEGRVKLNKYCIQDTLLVVKLIRNKKLDCLGKDFALSYICGVFVADLSAKGTQHTLRCKLLRLAHEDGFLIPTLGYEDGGEDDVSYEVRSIPPPPPPSPPLPQIQGGF